MTVSEATWCRSVNAGWAVARAEFHGQLSTSQKRRLETTAFFVYEYRENTVKVSSFSATGRTRMGSFGLFIGFRTKHKAFRSSPASRMCTSVFDASEEYFALPRPSDNSCLA